MMKAKIITLVLLLTIQVPSPTLSAQSKKGLKAETVKMIISSKNYKIDVDAYQPPYRDPILLDYSDNSIEIKNDSVFSDLLYLGQTGILYNIGKELIFQAPIKEYTMDIDKKGNAHVKFSANTTLGRYDFRINVYSNGDASIYVTMRRGQSASFTGKLNTYIEEK